MEYKKGLPMSPEKADLVNVTLSKIVDGIVDRAAVTIAEEIRQHRAIKKELDVKGMSSIGMAAYDMEPDIEKIFNFAATAFTEEEKVILITRYFTEQVKGVIGCQSEKIDKKIHKILKRDEKAE